MDPHRELDFTLPACRKQRILSEKSETKEIRVERSRTGVGLVQNTCIGMLHSSQKAHFFVSN
jgi:hypothetical protein